MSQLPHLGAARSATYGIPMILALEPRLMFDGAAVVDAAQQVDSSDVPVPTPTTESKEVAFVDTSVGNWQALAEGLRDGVEVVLIEQGQSGLDVMAQWAQDHSGYDAVHILSHGEAGTVRLGSDSLDSATLDSAAAELAALGNALKEDGDILLYGCQVADGEGGEVFLSKFAASTGADVAASDDLTGAASLGGDWELEKSVGVIATEIAATADMIASYDSVLVDATLTFESGTGSFSGDGTTALTFTETASTSGVQFTFTAKLEGGTDDDVKLGSVFGVPQIGTEDIYFGVNGKDASATMTIQNGKAFDLISFYLSNQGSGPSGDSDTFVITTSNGGSYTTGTLASDVASTLITLPDTAAFKGISWFTISPSTGPSAYMEVDNLVLTNITNAPTLATPTAISLTDTQASDSFGNSSGTLLGSDSDGTISGYGINGGTTGGSTDIGGTIYDVSKAGTYGTLYVKSGTGAYVYVPSASAVNAVTANQSETFTVTATDNSGAKANATLTVNVTGANDTPALSAPSAGSYTDTTAADTFSNTTGTLSSTDADTGATKTYGINTGATGGSTDVGGTIYDVSKAGTYGTLYVKSGTGDYVYVPGATAINAIASGASPSDSFTVTASDGSLSDSKTYTVNFAGADDAPTASGVPASVTVTEDSASNVDLSAISLSDVDTTGNITVTIAAGAGTLHSASGGGVTVSGSGTATLTLTGTVSSIDGFLNTASNIQYLGASNANGSPATTLTITANDGGAGGPVTLGTVNVNITAVNDNPSASGVPASITVTEDVAGNVDLTGISLSDVDAGASSVTFTITAAAGTLTASSGGGVTVSGSGTGTLALAGSVANINTFLGNAANIKYTTTSNSTTATTLALKVNDGGNSGTGGGGDVALGSVTVNITAINDNPTASGVPASITALEDTASNVDLSAISFADVDSGGSNVAFTIAAGAGTLTASSGGGVTVSGSGTGTLTLAGTASNIDTYLNTASNIKYTGAANVFGNGITTLTITANDGGNSGSGGGTDVALGSVTVNITTVADTPGVTNASTTPSTQTTSGLVLSRNAADGTEVTHFKITSISGGTLYKNNGTTVINDGDFITYAEGAAGLKFTPSGGGYGSFVAQASTSGDDSGLGGSTATATIAVGASVESPTINEDNDSGAIVITKGSSETHYKITSISGGTLYSDAGYTTPINNNDFIACAGATTNVYFRPTANFNGSAGFVMQASTSADDGGLTGSQITSTITVAAVADAPSVSSHSVAEDSASQAVTITRSANDGAETTHYKITGITGGTLYSDAALTQQINNNGFVASAGATTTVYFVPSANRNATTGGNGSFTVQASKSNADGGLGGATATSTITLTAVADTPSVASPTVTEDTDSGAIAITRSASDGAETTYYKITGISGGTLYSDAGYTTQINNGDFIASAGATTNVYFRPTANRNTANGGNGAFTVQASSSNADAGLGGSTVTSAITLTAVADTPSVTNASTPPDTQTVSGLVVSRASGDGGETTHFKITGITGGTLYKSDGVTAINNGDFITYAEGAAGLKFTPSVASTGGGFTVQASKAANDTGLGGSTVNAAISINTAPTASGATLSATGRVGDSFTYSLPAGTFTDADAGDSLSYSATGLPSGLSINATTGAIVGMPTAAGTMTATVTATDSGGLTATKTVTIAVEAAVTSSGNVVNSEPVSPPTVTVPIAPQLPPTPLPAPPPQVQAPEPPSVVGVTQVTTPPTLTAPAENAFQIAVVAKSAGAADALVVNVPMRDATVLEGSRISVTIPSDSFASTRANAVVTLFASNANGAALPPWLNFNPRNGTFEGTPPPGFRGEVVIKVVARDELGREAVQIFKIVVGESGQGRAAPAGQGEGQGEGQGGPGRSGAADGLQDQVQAKPVGKPGLAAQLKSMSREGRQAQQLAFVEALKRGGRAA